MGGTPHSEVGFGKEPGTHRGYDLLLRHTSREHILTAMLFSRVNGFLVHCP